LDWTEWIREKHDQQQSEGAKSINPVNISSLLTNMLKNKNILQSRFLKKYKKEANLNEIKRFKGLLSRDLGDPPTPLPKLTYMQKS
jgi:hypothetical protein